VDLQLMVNYIVVLSM